MAVICMISESIWMKSWLEKPVADVRVTLVAEELIVPLRVVLATTERNPVTGEQPTVALVIVGPALAEPRLFEAIGTR